MSERETHWRQGDLLTQESSLELRLIEPNQNSWAVVITHDCDLPHAGESFVEVIVAVICDQDDPQLSHAKHPRRLQLTFNLESGQGKVLLELRHVNRKLILKKEFDQKAQKQKTGLLPTNDKRTLKHWLAARYGRASFPNEFETRLDKAADKKNPIKKQIAKILDSEARHLVGLFFDLDSQRGCEAVKNEPYVLKVSVVYDSIEGGPEARGAAEQVAIAIKDLFEKTYGKPEVATEIALEACVAIADTDITLADLRRVDQWRLEYMSLRDDQSGDLLAVGETPA
jgi:hypothetical protein